MTKEQENELLKEFDIAARKMLVEELKKNEVLSFSTCGMDLNDTGELIKVIAAVRMAGGNNVKS